MTQIEQMIKDMCPYGVEWKTFADLGTFYGGLSGKNKDDFKDGNAKYITYLNIGCNPALRFDILETVKMGPNEKQNTVQYGDALFTGSSETPDECAMSSVVTEQPTENIYLNSFCFGFRFNSLDGICPAFYKHYFRCDAFRKAVRRTANGTTRFNVSKKEFGKLAIPIPPLEIQKKIVECLDKFSALAAELQAELHLRRKQYEYYRTHLLTPHSESNSAGDSTDDCNWVTKTLGDVCEINRGVRVVKSELSQEGGFPVYQNSLTPLGYYDKSNYPANTTFVISAGAAGKVGFSDVDFWAADDCLCFTCPDSLMSKYLYYQLMDKQDYFLSQVRHASVPRLSRTVVENFEVSFPSLKEQARIVSILDKFEALTTSLSDGIPAEQAAQQKRYEYYRDKLLTFPMAEK